jgi:hypothetical protein
MAVPAEGPERLDFPRAKPVEEPVPSRERAAQTAQSPHSGRNLRHVYPSRSSRKLEN